MVVRYFLPIVALALLSLAVSHVMRAEQEPPPLRPPIEPARNPFQNTVAGAGIIEPSTENISVGAGVPGVVVEVMIHVGEEVKAGTPLFRLNDRVLKARRKSLEASAAEVQAQLTRLENQPRSEQLPVLQAQVNEAQAMLKSSADQWKRTKELFLQKVTTEETLVQREQAFRQAEAHLLKADSELKLIQAGAWEYDKQVTRAELLKVQSQIEEIDAELDRLTVRALVDAEVLQVNVRPGEFVGAPPSQPLVVLGDVRQLHVRVDIDEYDIHRINLKGPASANLKGNPEELYSLRLVRIEPFVIPKRSLTGDNRERVDTRVMQVIYAFDPPPKTHLFVGQQVDVFIDGGEKKEVKQ